MRGMEIMGGPAHTGVLRLKADYFGGIEKHGEGGTLVQWYRSIFAGPFLPILGATQRDYWPTLDDVGSVIKAKAIPVRDDLNRGEMAECIQQIPLCICPKMQNTVHRMLVYQCCDFKVARRQGGEDFPRVISMDTAGLTVSAGQFEPLTHYYDVQRRGRVGNASGDNRELYTQWEPDIAVVYNPAEPEVFTILFCQDDEYENGIFKIEFACASQSARDLITLCIRSFSSYNYRMGTWTRAGIAPALLTKEEQHELEMRDRPKVAGQLMEGISEFRKLWKKVVQGEESVRPALLDTVDKVDVNLRSIEVIPTGAYYHIWTYNPRFYSLLLGDPDRGLLPYMDI